MVMPTATRHQQELAPAMLHKGTFTLVWNPLIIPFHVAWMTPSCLGFLGPCIKVVPSTLLNGCRLAVVMHSSWPAVFWLAPAWVYGSVWSVTWRTRLP